METFPTADFSAGWTTKKKIIPSEAWREETQHDLRRIAQVASYSPELMESIYLLLKAAVLCYHHLASVSYLRSFFSIFYREKGEKCERQGREQETETWYP